MIHATFLHLSFSFLFIDFDMSKAQEHVLAIQYLAPRLATLRIANLGHLPAFCIAGRDVCRTRVL